MPILLDVYDIVSPCRFRAIMPLTRQASADTDFALSLAILGGVDTPSPPFFRSRCVARSPERNNMAAIIIGILALSFAVLMVFGISAAIIYILSHPLRKALGKMSAKGRAKRRMAAADRREQIRQEKEEQAAQDALYCDITDKDGRRYKVRVTDSGRLFYTPLYGKAERLISYPCSGALRGELERDLVIRICNYLPDGKLADSVETFYDDLLRQQ